MVRDVYSDRASSNSVLANAATFPDGIYFNNHFGYFREATSGVLSVETGIRHRTGCPEQRASLQAKDSRRDNLALAEGRHESRHRQWLFLAYRGAFGIPRQPERLYCWLAMVTTAAPGC